MKPLEEPVIRVTRCAQLREKAQDAVYRMLLPKAWQFGHGEEDSADGGK